MIFDLVQDFGAVIEAMPDGHPRRGILALLDEAIRRDVHFLDRHPTTLFQCLWNACWWYDCPEAANHHEPPVGGWVLAGPAWSDSEGKLSAMLEMWRALKERLRPGAFWVRSLRPPQQPLGSGLLAKFEGNGSAVHHLLFSRDGERLFSATSGTSLRGWLLDSCQECYSARMNRFGGRAVALTPDWRVVAGATAHDKIVVWDFRSRQSVELRGHRGRRQADGGILGADIRALAVSRDGRLVASGGFDRTVRLWDTATGRQLHCLLGHREWLQDVAFSPDGQELASMDEERACLWEVSSRRELKRFPWLEALVDNFHRQAFGYSPDNRYFVFRDADTVRVWDRFARKEIAGPHGLRKHAHCLAFRPDSPHAAVGDESSVQVWDLSTGTDVYRFKDIVGPVRTLAFSPDGVRLAVGSEHGEIVLINLSSQNQLRLQDFREAVTRLEFAPDGQRLAAGLDDGSVFLWDTSQVNSAGRLRGHRSSRHKYGYHVSFAPDGLQCASAGEDGEVLLWDARSGRLAHCLSGHEANVNDLGYTSDGGLLGSCSDDGTVRLWNAHCGLLRACLPGPGESLQRLQFSPDGRYVGAGAWGGKALIWAVAGAQPVLQFSGHEDAEPHRRYIDSIAFSPCGRLVATGGGDRACRVWDARTGEEVWRLGGHEESVSQVAFSPDGTLLASHAMLTHDIKMWDLATGQLLFARKVPGLHRLRFSRDSHYLLVVPTRTGTMTVLEARTGADLGKRPGTPDASAILTTELGSQWCTEDDGQELTFLSITEQRVMAWFPAAAGAFGALAVHFPSRTFALVDRSQVHLGRLELAEAKGSVW